MNNALAWGWRQGACCRTAENAWALLLMQSVPEGPGTGNIAEAATS
jgi:hypothetical protein